MRNDDDIRTEQRRLEGVAAPLGEGSENSQLLQKLLYENYTGTKHTTRGAGNFWNMWRVCKVGLSTFVSR